MGEDQLNDEYSKIEQAQKKYQRSKKGKESVRTYAQSEPGKKSQTKYIKSSKGKLAQRKYYYSPKGQEAFKRISEKLKPFKEASKWLKENPDKTFKDYEVHRWLETNPGKTEEDYIVYLKEQEANRTDVDSNEDNQST